jgi:hypothetical protein
MEPPRLRYLVFQASDESIVSPFPFVKQEPDVTKDLLIPFVTKQVLPGRLGIFLTAVFEDDPLPLPKAKVLIYLKPSILLRTPFLVRVGEWSKSNRGQEMSVKDMISTVYGREHCITLPFLHERSCRWGSRQYQWMNIAKEDIVKFTVQKEYIAGPERPLIYRRTNPEYFQQLFPPNTVRFKDGHDSDKVVGYLQ